MFNKINVDYELPCPLYTECVKSMLYIFIFKCIVSVLDTIVYNINKTHLECKTSEVLYKITLLGRSSCLCKYSHCCWSWSSGKKAPYASRETRDSSECRMFTVSVSASQFLTSLL
ncbi:hypothetical protein KIL84_013133 [Mauremys mutica]|uniref:Uncharacterized protein n=1 Tax=Mauremys mutica TaxID=74926 RepID=A0A9D3WXI0_9SAUR|nr:hypothetical protein KIL84_013133 [Mauremys mutica]